MNIRLVARGNWTAAILVRGMLGLACAAATGAMGSAVLADESTPQFRASIDAKIGLPCTDCDGVALGDITGDGGIDILAASGKEGEAFWFEPGGSLDDWTRHEIYQIPDASREIEGSDLGDFDGDGRLEAISLDQRNGVIYLHKQTSDPRAQWTTVALQEDRPFVQASMAVDLRGKGRQALVYTWEGTAPGAGGVHWLEFTGTDVLNPDHWTDHVMVQHESAWWLAPRRADLNGNGRAGDIVFTARNIVNRNPGARPGVYWLEEPGDVTDRWQVHSIDTALPHPLHIDFGDFSGDGNGLDLVVGGFETNAVHWYRFSNGWERSAVPVPDPINGVSPDRVWNVKAVPMPSGPDAILAPVTGERRGALILFEKIDGAFRPNILETFDYGHPMDDRILLHDFTGDGRPEIIIPDSGPGVNTLWILRLRWTAP